MSSLLPSRRKSADPRVDFLAGAAAGCTVRATLFPVDTIKTNMQRSGASLSATVQQLLPHRSAVPALYRGLAPALAEVGVNRGALMGVSTGLKQLLPPDLPVCAALPAAFSHRSRRVRICIACTHPRRRHRRHAARQELARDAAAGFAAGVLKTTTLHPLDTLTCRGQAAPPPSGTVAPPTPPPPSPANRRWEARSGRCCGRGRSWRRYTAASALPCSARRAASPVALCATPRRTCPL